MIRTLRLVDFKGHRDSTLQLSRLTALAGPNNTGKTSALRAAELLDRLIHAHHLSDVFVGPRDHPLLVRRGCQRFRLEFTGSAGTPLTYTSESPQAGTWTFGGREIVHNPARGLAGTGYEQLLRSVGYFKLTTAQLARPSYSPDEHPPLQPDGYGLATLIDYLKGYAPDRFEALGALAREVIPSIHRLRTRRREVTADLRVAPEHQGRFTSPTAPVAVIGHELVFDMDHAPNLPALAVSSGALLTVGLLALLLSPTGPKVALLDDVGLGLHPDAQRRFTSALRQLLDDDPDLQILLATRSPHLVDGLEPDEVQLATWDDGAARVTPREAPGDDAAREAE